MLSQEIHGVAAPGYRYPFAGGALSGTEYGDWSPAYAPTGASEIAAPAAAPNQTLSGFPRVCVSLFICNPSHQKQRTPAVFNSIRRKLSASGNFASDIVCADQWRQIAWPFGNSRAGSTVSRFWFASAGGALHVPVRSRIGHAPRSRGIVGQVVFRQELARPLRLCALLLRH